LIDMEQTVELFEADLLVDGSFDECFRGCSAVFHVASPFILGSKDPQKELIDPAVKGTLNVLESCKRVGVKRVVLTSSCAAIVETDSAETPEKYEGKVWTEKDWNTSANIENAPYFYSKVLAEKAAWEFCEKNDIALTTICPNFVMGPPLSQRADGTSVGMAIQLLNGAFVDEGAPNFSYGLVHVRTVSEAHVAALGNKRAENERFLVGGRVGRTVLDIIGFLRLEQRFAKRNMATKLAAPCTYSPSYDNSKAVEILGLRFRPPVIGVIRLGLFLLKNGMIDAAKDEDDNKLSIE